MQLRNGHQRIAKTCPLRSASSMLPFYSNDTPRYHISSVRQELKTDRDRQKKKQRKTHWIIGKQTDESRLFTLEKR